MRRLLAALLLLMPFWLSAQILNRPVAVVRLTETANLGVRELTEQLGLFESQAGRTLNSEERQLILDAMINDLLLLQAARRAGVRVGQADVQNYINAQRAQFSQAVGQQLNEAQFRAQVEQQTGEAYTQYVENVTDELIKLQFVQQRQASLFQSQSVPNEADIQSFYEENATSFTNPAMVRFEHVYIDLRGLDDEARRRARETLDELYRRVRNGVTSFDSLMEESLDDPRFSGDDFGYLLRNDPRGVQLLGRTFIDQVFALDEGDTEGIVESNAGVHIVNVLDKRGPRILGLDDPILPGQSVTVRQQIRNLLAQQQQQAVLQQAVDGVVADLREEAEITIFEENLPW
jgi:peptidyl-prolyl cis-trans isomerase SurA